VRREAPTLSRLTEGGEVVSLTRRPSFTPMTIPGTHFFQRLSTSGSESGWKDYVK
jgi:hypothetical protein